MKILIAIFGLSLLLIGCGPPPGEAVCQQFKKAVIDWRQRDIDFFKFREEVAKVKEKAASAEPELQVATNGLVHSSNSVSEVRLEVSIKVMGEACAKLGYLKQYTF